MIDGKALWAPDFGKPCDCVEFEGWEEDCPHVEPVYLSRATDVDGVTWVFNPFFAAVMLRLDKVEFYDGGQPDGWFDWHTGGPTLDQAHRVLRQLLDVRPVAASTVALFRRAFAEPLLAAGCRILPTDRRLRDDLWVHAVMHGEDLVGWIVPADPSKPRTVEGDVFMRLPNPSGAHA